MAEKTIKCALLRDRWDEDGKRHRKGEEIDLPAEAAIDAIEEGAVARVKANK